MHELTSFSEFIIDIFCFSISHDFEKSIEIPDYLPVVICISGIVLLAFSLVQKIINTHIKENKVVVYILAILIIGLSFGFISFKEYNFMFSVLYVPLIFVFRGLEGGAIGSSFKPKVWLWVLIPLIGIITLLYFLLRENKTLAYLTIIWSVVGISFASYRWVMFFKKSNSFSLNRLSFVALFIIFFGTMLYIPNSKGDEIIHLIMLPVGFIFGILYKSKWFEKFATQNTKNSNNSN